jgi:H+/Cl- antiporter ClcA
MKTWFKKFWWVHGERHIYGFYAFAMACMFVYIGKSHNMPEFTGAGTTILIGLATLFFNRVRGNGKEPLKPEKE